MINEQRRTIDANPQAMAMINSATVQLYHCSYLSVDRLVATKRSSQQGRSIFQINPGQRRWPFGIITTLCAQFGSRRSETASGSRLDSGAEIQHLLLLQAKDGS